MIEGMSWSLVAVIVGGAVIIGYLAQITTELANISRELRNLRTEFGERMDELPAETDRGVAQLAEYMREAVTPRRDLAD